MLASQTKPSLDRERMLRWIAGLGAATASALAEHLGVSLPSARARLAHARGLGLIERHDVIRDRPELYTTTRAGLRACGATGLDPCRVSPSGARHLAVCSQVAARLERIYPDRLLSGERELRREERLQGRSLASARLDRHAKGVEGLHRPDLVLRGPDRSELPVVVEVELSVKAQSRLDAICLAWARSRAVAGVIYLVNRETAPPVRAAVARARGGETIAVVDLGCLPEGELPGWPLDG